ncbi:CGNR zinc finger domain-containing protein [Pseudonocardia adelaidensis]|uniref:CGNR zinc finger domain-containing protein n=1 Tax=Pseudonocardia adelaidensis TaxID=648754 RepID=A0ABP9P0A3_9PSEU
MPHPVAREDEVLLLELLNSTPVVDGVQRDLLAVDGEAGEWARARGGSGASAEIARLRRVRDRLQAVVRGAEPADALAPFLDGVHLVPELGKGGLRWTLDVTGDARLSARVLLAWGHLQETMPGRLRPCANDECRLFLLDRSKPNSARWCSMKVCGNRLKARRHYERTHRTT